MPAFRATPIWKAGGPEWWEPDQFEVWDISSSSIFASGIRFGIIYLCSEACCCSCCCLRCCCRSCCSDNLLRAFHQPSTAFDWFFLSLSLSLVCDARILRLMATSVGVERTTTMKLALPNVLNRRRSKSAKREYGVLSRWSSLVVQSFLGRLAKRWDCNKAPWGRGRSTSRYNPYLQKGRNDHHLALSWS